VKDDVSPDPVGVSLFRAQAEVAHSGDRAHPVEKFRLTHNGEVSGIVLSSAARGEALYSRVSTWGQHNRLSPLPYVVLPSESAFAAPLRSYTESFGRICVRLLSIMSVVFEFGEE
jgi:hypothetical protein